MAFFATFKRSRGVSSLGTIIVVAVEGIATMEKIEVERRRVSERSMNNFGVVDGRKAIDWNFHQPFARARAPARLFIHGITNGRDERSDEEAGR